MLVKTELKEQVTKMQYEAHVMPPPTPPESYCGAGDEKLLLEEQEQEGELELLLEKGCRAAGGQPVIEAYDLTCSTTPPPGGVPPATAGAGAVPRKARIGKSMAREMVYAAQQHQQQLQQQAQAKLSVAVTETGTGTDAPAPEMPFVLKAEIKAETKIKIEQDGEEPAQATSTHISQLPDLKPTIKTEPEQEQDQDLDLEPEKVKEKQKESNGAVAKVEQEPNQKKEEQPEERPVEDQETPPMDQDEELVPPEAGGSGGKQRLNLMASTSASASGGGATKKATKHQSYKSLIKQAEPKNYLCPGRKFVRRHGRAPAKYAKRRQQLLVQRQQRLRLQQQQRRRQEREALANATEPTATAEEAVLPIKPPESAAEEPQTTPSASPKRARPRKQEIAALHLLDTAHSRGYFSDPELNHSSRNQAATAAATAAAAAAAAAYVTPSSLVAAHQPAAGEKRSKSETKKPVAEAAAPPAKKPRKQPAAKATKGKGKAKGRKPNAEEAEGPEAAGVLPESGSGWGSAANPSPAQETNNNEYQTADLQAQKLAEATAPAVVAEESPAVGGQQHSEEQPEFRMPDQPVVPPLPPPVRHNPTATKRTRSRSKFGNRRRQKQRAGGVSYELDETQPPATKANVVPKWNNGWMWAGKPFQGAVFLNVSGDECPS